NLVLQMISDRELEKVTGDALVSKDRPRIFDRRANVKVLALRVVGRNEVEAGRIFVVNAGRIHETAGAGRLECFGKLPDLKLPEVRRKRDQLVLFQESNHFRLPALVRFEK